jgi:glutaredoxin
MILFTASWCANCPSVKKYIEENSIEGVELVDVDSQPEIAAQNGVRGLPTLVDKNDVVVGAEKIINYLKEV